MADEFKVGSRVKIDDERMMGGSQKGTIIRPGIVDAVPLKRWIVKTDSGKEVSVLERYLELKEPKSTT